VIPALNMVYTCLTGVLVDSIETLEQEYVLVSAPDNLTMSLSTSGVSQYPGQVSPQKTASGPFMVTAGSRGWIGSGASNGSVLLHSSQDSAGDALEGPSLHPSNRLSSLQRCARLVAELANEKV
jgi:hypothetical protein